MAWGKNGTPHTLASSGASVEITDLSALKFNQFISFTIPDSTAQTDLTYNSDSGSNYARRGSSNGGTDSTNLSQSYIDLNQHNGVPTFIINYTCWISGEEKLGIIFSMSQWVAGAGYAPQRWENAIKYVPSPDASLSEVKINKRALTNFATGSNISALGTD